MGSRAKTEGGSVMRSFLMTWGNNAENAGGHLRGVDWSIVDQKLSEIFAVGGSVMLALEEEHETGPHSLEVLIEHDLYLLSLLEYLPDSSNVRSYTNLAGAGKMIEIGGNLWSDLLLCSDFSIVKNAFVEFFQTGDVSKDVLA